MSRPRQLTDAQAAELRRRYALWRANTPKKLCAEFGLSKTALRIYINAKHAKQRQP